MTDAGDSEATGGALPQPDPLIPGAGQAPDLFAAPTEPPADPYATPPQAPAPYGYPQEYPAGYPQHYPAGYDPTAPVYDPALAQPWVPYGPPPQRARKFAGGAIAGGIAITSIGPVLVALVWGAAVSAASSTSTGSSAWDFMGTGFGAALIALHVALIPGVILVIKGSPNRRGLGMGLLIGYPVAFLVAPILGILACFGAFGS